MEIDLNKKSEAWKLNCRNFLKGLIYSVATALFTEVSTWQVSGTIEIDYKRLLIVIISGLAGYLLIKLPQGKNGNYGS